MSEKYIIDRIEGEYAILERENGDMCKVLVKNIKGNFDEGDVLAEDGEFFKLDEDFTKIRKDNINHIMKDMWE